MARRRSTAKLASRRDASLNAIPYQLPPVREKEADGKLHVTVQFNRPRWQQMLGADQTCERTFALDAYGRQVYESCNGQRTVREIISRFAQHAKVSKPESEMAVTRFMRTLLVKGLIAMQMEKPSS